MHKIAAITTTAAVLSACTAPIPQASEARLGMANPASVFCVQQGGKLRMAKTERGEHGICMLPDGREIEEWAFFRQHHSASK